MATNQSSRKQWSERANTDALFASIGEGIIATDTNGKIIRINKTALHILGYQKEELIGAWFPNTIVATFEDGSAIDIMERPITKAALTGRPVKARTIYRHKAGHLVPVSLTVSPIMFDGKPVGAIEVFRDITHEIRVEKMKSEFISIASHQLRTPLSAINIYTHMLSDGIAGPLSAEQSEFVGSILMSVERMNKLISTLLNITRIEAGGVNVNIAPVKLQTLADEIVEENLPAAKERQLSLVRRISASLPVVHTDALLVKEVYSNLLSNAIKYTPAGGTVSVSLSAKGTNLLFAVRDTGFGIPLDAQEHIFSKFFRADNILSEDVSGTGLGLYLTKTIADSLGGDLWFKSQQDAGSTFYFSLPLQGSIARNGKFKLD